MVRVALVLALLGAVALLVFVVIRAVTRPVVRESPDPLASNATWAQYYQRLSYDAHRRGDEHSAVMYGSLADTYAGLDEP